MLRLRTLAGVALVAGLFAGLTSCANFKGDLGADLDTMPTLATQDKGKAGKSLLDVASPADLNVAEAVDISADVVDLKDLKNARPQAVSENKVAKFPSVNPPKDQVPPVKLDTATPNETPRIADGGEAEAVAIELKEVKKVEVPKVAPITINDSKPIADDKDNKNIEADAAKIASAQAELEKLANAKIEAEKAEAAKVAAAKAEAEKIEAEKLAAAKMEAEKAEAAKVAAAKAEADKIEAEKLVAAKMEAEKAEAAKVAAAKAEAEKIEAEKLAAAKMEAEKAEAAKVAAAKAEAEKIEAEKMAAAKMEAEKAEAEKVAAAKVEAEKIEAEKLAAAKMEAEKAEAAKVAAAKAEAEKIEAEKLAAAKMEAEKAEAAKVAAAKAEAEKIEAEKLAAAKMEAEKAEAAKVAAAKAEAEKIEAEKLAAAKMEAEKAETAKVAAAKVEAEKIEAEKLVAAKMEAEKAEAAKVAAAKVEAEKIEAEKLVAAKIEAEKAEAAKVAAVRAAEPKPLSNAYLANADGDDKPKDPPAPVTPPKDETPEARAERLLKEAAKTSSVQVQSARAEAEANYQAGLRAFNEWEYEKALKFFDLAVLQDPLHKEADEKRRICRSLLNIDVNPIGAKIRALENEKRVQMQEQMISLAHAMEDARAFEVRGSENVLDADASQKTRALGDRKRQLEQAQDRYRRVLEVMNWMPPTMELPELRKTAEDSLNRVRGKIEKVDEEVSFIGRNEALQRSLEGRQRESEQFRMRIAKLLEQVKALYDVQDYKGAELMAQRVLMIDPMNASAESWKKKARSQGHSHEDQIYKENYSQEYRSAMLLPEEGLIATDAILTYPSNWDQISKRQDVTFGKKVAEDTWKSELRKKLQRKVSFEFVDTPLAEAVEFLRHFANVTMIIDPKVLAAQPPAINLRVTDMNLDLALEWILKLAELEYAFQDQAIFISKPQNLLQAVEMKIYDVSDLTQSIQDFPGPEFQITVAGDKAGGGGAGAANPFLQKPAGNAPTNQAISDMIRTRVRPETWAAEQGTSIEERGGRLVVMQRPEIHKLIDQLLSNFRSTQKMMINIESRFLNIREAYLEETGVEYQGLDPNVLFGDFGDLRRLGAPTGFVQPRVPGGTDTSPPNLPFPGFTNTGGGNVTQIGSIINHAINVNQNDPETITGLDQSNTVRNGGFSGQVSILNNTQVQAFIRALAVRENTSTLIAPRLTVFNTQRANMFIARQQSYVADYEISGDSYDPVIRQFLVGVVLDVKPIVSSDRRYVTLELRPTVTELVNFTTRQIDSFTVNSGAQVNVLVSLSFPIQFPELSIRRVRTTATVPDGGIMLVGGLYRNLKFNAENGVPFLSDLPVVGRLFRWNTVDNAKSNLAILVSPRIILFNEEEEKLIR